MSKPSTTYKLSTTYLYTIIAGLLAAMVGFVLVVFFNGMLIHQQTGIVPSGGSANTQAATVVDSIK